MPLAYYNENDPYCAAWLRNLISENLIALGDVDDRDIRDVRPVDLRGYAQCHFFAGLGGWSRALRLAGVGDHRPLWTGSCPCQPFSSAGARRGFADERDLWPDWQWLIAQCRPPTVFGEQVARATVWFDRLCADMEGEEYACSAAVLPACGVDAPHKRDRLWFVAHADSERLEGRRRGKLQKCSDEWLARSNGSSVSNTASSGRGQRETNGGGGGQGMRENEWAGLAGGRGWLPEPPVGRVAHGVPARVAKLRALGNAIVPHVAVEFIKAALG